MTKSALAVEFILLFVLLPLGYRFSPVRLSPLPWLWVAALYCYLVLRHSADFPMTRLWNAAAGTGRLSSVLTIFAVVTVVFALGVRWLAPQLLFGMVRARPGLWALVMVLYPVLSVYPQSIVYRAFLMHRYAGLVAGLQLGDAARNALLILASAAAFAFVHIIFRNPLAVALTFAGGLLFAWRYQTSGSLAISALEHALYGCMLFTLGLGQYFYHGRIRLQ